MNIRAAFLAITFIFPGACSSPPPPQSPPEPTAVEQPAPEPAEPEAPEAPEPEPEPVAPATDTGSELIVKVTAIGEIAIDGAVTAPADLVATFTSARERDPATRVVIETEPGASQKRIIEIMDAAKSAGISKIAIAPGDK